MRKLPFLYVVPYFLVVLAVFAALNPLLLVEFPRLNLYEGELAFSEERTLADLQTLLQRFPDRSPGSPSNQAAAQWMAERFRQMGLDTRLEFFETLAPEDIWSPGFLFRPFNLTHWQIRGANVLAYSQGRSPSVVLLMANRDVRPSAGPAALGNAAGSALLLEMARVLTESDHFYSYLFVSTDAEDTGRQGARYLAQFHPDLSLRLAIYIDDVAAEGARYLHPYHLMSARQASPLWTMALARQVMAAQGLADPLDGEPGEGHPLALFFALLQQRGWGVSPYEHTGVFVERGDAVLGVAAVNPSAPGGLAAWLGFQPSVAGASSEETPAPDHPATLSMAGRFIEQYIRSLALNQFGPALLARSYVIWGDRYLPPASVSLFVGLLLAAFALFAALPFLYPPVKWHAFANFLERDLPWLMRLAGLAFLSGAVWLLPRLPIMRVFPPVIFLLTTAGIALLGGLRIVRQRMYFLRLWHFEPTLAHQRRFLVIALAFLFLAYSLLLSPLAAAGMLLLPFLVWSVARFRQAKNRRVWAILFGGWTLLHLLLGTLALYTVMNHAAPWTLTGLLAFTLNSALWLVILVYVFSTPPLGVIERR